MRAARSINIDPGSLIHRQEEVREVNGRADWVVFRGFRASDVAAELVQSAAHGLPTERLLWGDPLVEEGLALAQSFSGDGTQEVAADAAGLPVAQE